MKDNRTIIIGNGIAGQSVADGLRKKNPNMEILIITEELYTYYSRIFLPAFITGEKSQKDLIIRKDAWFEEKNITIKQNTRVTHIDTKNKSISTKSEGVSEELTYDHLVLAVGAHPRFFDYGKPGIDGLFALRTIEDGRKIKQFLAENQVKNPLIVGGGLLGIELAFHLSQMDQIEQVTICEVGPYLLVRQLDEQTSHILEKFLENMKIKTVCSKPVKEILGSEKVVGVKLEGGMEMPFDMILEQIGVIPNIDLAKESGIAVDRGIIADENLKTNAPDLYAVGDCVQFNKQIWGIIPACLDQGKIVIDEISKIDHAPYKGTFWATRLKIAGIKLSSFGTPPKIDCEGDCTKENVRADDFMSRKVLLNGDILKGAVFLGEVKDSYFMKNIGKQVDLKELEKELFQ